jgi:hypothetical protein
MKQQNRRRAAGLGLAAGLTALLLGSSAWAEPGKRAIDEDHPGYPYYRAYCATCHGVFADGKGPIAPFLKRQPTDLSRLTHAYGSPLPRAKVAAFIEGATMPDEHGRSDMPVWGKRLRSEMGPPSHANQPAERMIVNLIVDYLVAIQVDEKP